MRWLTALVAALLLTACVVTPDEQGRFVALPAEGWAYGDTVAFDSLCADSVATGRLAVSVRHTNAYLYSNLWLELTTPQGDSVRRDTINMPLADDFGRWYGRGVGVSFATIDTLPGSYTLLRQRPVYVRHIMRCDTLGDIEQIGLVFINE